MENKKLVNVKNGDGEDDFMVKRQIESYVSNKTGLLNAGFLACQSNS